ncbi:MAG: patatin family protein [Bacteroidales bacterium]|nr:patatin family protein [Bacteroidales bacterium]
MTGLVLEGGGMRGVFTAGVLDYLLDAGITFPYAVAVSAGAGHGLSYKSKQRGRAKKTCIDMLKRYNYVGVKQLWNTRSIFNQKIIYDLIPNEILPFDFEMCFADFMRYEMVTTNCLTGLAEYHSERYDAARLLQVAKASGSLPFGCPICMLDGVPMLDGGITDPIPVDHALEMGCDRLVVVLTRNKGYRDTMPRLKNLTLMYSEYPRLRVALSHIADVYNAQLDRVEELEREGRALVLRPEAPLQIDRLSTNLVNLYALYDEAYDIAIRELSKWKNSTPEW